MSLDNELHEALRRKEPPEGFTARVLSAVVEDRRPRLSSAADRRGRLSSTARAAIAAALLLTVLGGGEAVRIVRAKQQMLTALHITSAKLRDARNHVISTR
jgi:hypothetical protein